MSQSYTDQTLTIDDRLGDLLGRMTLDEKLAQLGCVWSTQLVEDDAFSEARRATCSANGTGQITRIGSSTGLRPAESAAFANRIQRWLGGEDAARDPGDRARGDRRPASPRATRPSFPRRSGWPLPGSPSSSRRWAR